MANSTYGRSAARVAAWPLAHQLLAVVRCDVDHFRLDLHRHPGPPLAGRIAESHFPQRHAFLVQAGHHAHKTTPADVDEWVRAIGPVHRDGRTLVQVEIRAVIEDAELINVAVAR